jgi:hypothetical protein
MWAISTLHYLAQLLFLGVVVVVFHSTGALLLLALCLLSLPLSRCHVDNLGVVAPVMRRHLRSSSSFTLSIVLDIVFKVANQEC